jgi:hypothetical protein
MDLGGIGIGDAPHQTRSGTASISNDPGAAYVSGDESKASAAGCDNEICLEP